MILTDSIKSLIKMHALREQPNECCGLVYGEMQVCLCNNISAEPLHQFTIDPQDYLLAKGMGNILAFYHSHLNQPNFSEFDKLNSETHNLPLILYCLSTEEFSIYEPKGYEIPYVGREYIHATVDCVSLVRDYYLREKNLTISDIVHPYRLIEDKAGHPDNNRVHPLVRDHLIENGFVEVFDLKKHDVLLMKTFRIQSPVHCGIYLDRNQLLHHPFKHRSTIEMFSNYWKARTLHTMRHKTLL